MTRNSYSFSNFTNFALAFLPVYAEKICWPGSNQHQEKCGWCGTKEYCCKKDLLGIGIDTEFSGFAVNSRCVLNPGGNHTVNSGSKMIGAKHVTGKKIYWSTCIGKSKEKKNLTSYIVLLSHQPNSTGQSANWAGFYGAC